MLKISLFAILALLISAKNLGGITNITITDKLTVWLYATNIARITTLPDQVIEKPTATSRVVTYIPSESIPYTILNPDSNTIIIATSDIQIKCNKNRNLITFYDITDIEMKSAILTEYNKTFTSMVDTASNNKTYKILQEWIISNTTKALYGWGQYQNGFINYIGSTIRCVQFNTEACIPMIITNSAYGIYWDNYGVSTLNSIKTEAKPNNISIGIDDMPNGTHCIWYNLSIPFIASNLNGDRYFFSYFNNWTRFGASLLVWEGWLEYGYIEFYVERGENNVTELIEIFNYSYNVPSTLAMKPFYMNAGEKVTLILKYQCFNDIPIIYYREPSNVIDIEANQAFYIDYYFIYAAPNKYESPVKQSSLDGVIKGYRLLTEHAPLYELSNYGFWQCQNRYFTQYELINDAKTYREKELPIDAIVQDYKYWGSDQNWGPQWNPSTYPDPSGMMQQLHNMSFYFMISVESQFGINSTCLKFLKSQESITNNIEIIPGTINNSKLWIDPYNKQAQIDYYQCIKNTMFDIGVDAIWSDATEPQPFVQYNELLDNNKYSGNMLFNTFSFELVKSISNGLNKDFPHKRPFDLARSTFAGQSKTGGAVWSGDTTSNYDQLRRQITASLSTQSAGNPYWSQDIGGFFRPTSCDQYTCWWFLQLLIRWFQFGAFAPIFRTHGNNVNTSYWNYGPIVLKNVHLIDNLRYRLLPYIYSNAYYITNYGYTLQRPLIFDFYDDINVFKISQQFMFGPYILVSPVFTFDNTTNIYIPSKYKIWYDFWTGSIVDGGSYMENIIIPLSEIPLHIHCGSILIMGPISQFANQYYPWNELEIRLYIGDDASFIYFNDDGKDRMSLKNNQFTTILFQWHDTKKILNIGRRQGNYTGMVDSIKLNIVIVSEGHGVGINVTQIPDKTVIYTGSAMSVNF